MREQCFRISTGDLAHPPTPTYTAYVHNYSGQIHTAMANIPVTHVQPHVGYQLEVWKHLLYKKIAILFSRSQFVAAKLIETKGFKQKVMLNVKAFWILMLF